METKPDMKAEEAKRELAEKWGIEYVDTGGFAGYKPTNPANAECLSDLNALLDEHYVEREKYERVLNQLAIHEEDCGVDD